MKDIILYLFQIVLNCNIFKHFYASLIQFWYLSKPHVFHHHAIVTGNLSVAYEWISNNIDVAVPQGLAIAAVRFRFDGQPINELDTPTTLEMEEGDTIEVYQQQTGGFSCWDAMHRVYKMDYMKFTVPAVFTINRKHDLFFLWFICTPLYARLRSIT